MKYWRGFLVAAILAVCNWGLRTFSAEHSKLVDLIYPYITRMMQGNLAQWSSVVSYSVWQMAVNCAIIVALALLAMMFVRHWSPIRLVGWFLAVISVVNLTTTIFYGLNEYAGPLAEDLRMETNNYAYSTEELETAAIYYQDQANALAEQVERQGKDLKAGDFDQLAAQAGDGFDHLVYEDGYSVFAGCKLPVKQLANPKDGEMGKTMPLTGESFVNPQLPMTVLPYAINHEMAHRMSIAIDRDADFAAFLACTANESVEYQYSGYVMAYRSCLRELEAVGGKNRATQVANGESALLKADMKAQTEFFGETAEASPDLCDLLVCWHVETVVWPSLVEEEVRFDPTDETQVDLSGIVNAR